MSPEFWVGVVLGYHCVVGGLDTHGLAPFLEDDQRHQLNFGDSPFAVAPSAGGFTTINPDPPASGTVPSDDYLGVAIAIANDNVTSTPPTNYDERVDVNINSTEDAFAAIATRELSAITSEDPGTFTLSASEWSYATTILVKQAVAAAGGGNSQSLIIF